MAARSLRVHPCRCSLVASVSRGVASHVGPEDLGLGGALNWVSCERPDVSTTVVGTALATGSMSSGLTFRSRGGECRISAEQSHFPCFPQSRFSSSCRASGRASRAGCMRSGTGRGIVRPNHPSPCTLRTGSYAPSSCTSDTRDPERRPSTSSPVRTRDSGPRQPDRWLPCYSRYLFACAEVI